MAQVNIAISDQSTTVAPAAVFLKAVAGGGFNTGTAPAGTPYDPTWHEITYIWTVKTGPAMSFERAPFLNMPPEWKAAGLYYGPEVAIVFDQPGTYDIELYAVDQFGNDGMTTTTVVVANADGRFPGTDTICYSQTDFNGAPAGATQVTSFAALSSAIANKAGGDVRVLFRAGNDFRSAITSQINLTQANIAALGSFGSGAKPIIPLLKQSASPNQCIFGLSQEGNELKVYNLDIRGGWDAVRERGFQGASPIWRDTNSDILFHRCRLSGHNTLSSQARAGDCFFVWSDGEVTDWQNFGLFGFASGGGVKRFAIIGSDIHQNTDARQGKASEQQMSNAHGPLRHEGLDGSMTPSAGDRSHVYFHCYDAFSRGGWSPGGGGTADQPATRVNSNGTLNYWLNADRCTFESGYRVLKITGQDEYLGTPDRPGNKVFDKIVLMGTTESQWLVDCNQGGTTFRNCLGFMANVPMFSAGVDQALFAFNPDDTSDPNNANTPVAAYGCTLVSLLTSANNRNVEVLTPDNVSGIFESGFNNTTFENNIEYMPNQNAPVTPVALETTTPSGVSPRFQGMAESVSAVSKTGNGSNTITISYSELLDSGGNPTSQAYWQARVAAGSTWHFLLSDWNYEYLHADLGELSVSFNATDVTVSRTSGTWANGETLRVKLDQSDNLPTVDTTTAISSINVPIYGPMATTGIAGGWIPVDDIRLTPRKGFPRSSDPQGTPTRGVVEYTP
ncbi:MAG: hypothetical protein HKM96_02465 [Boseongicola sp.]|nr:hypothetical protein [Boseongicola sp.]